MLPEVAGGREMRFSAAVALVLVGARPFRTGPTGESIAVSERDGTRGGAVAGMPAWWLLARLKKLSFFRTL